MFDFKTYTIVVILGEKSHLLREKNERSLTLHHQMLVHHMTDRMTLVHHHMIGHMTHLGPHLQLFLSLIINEFNEIKIHKHKTK